MVKAMDCDSIIREFNPRRSPYVIDSIFYKTILQDAEQSHLITISIDITTFEENTSKRFFFQELRLKCDIF